MSAPASTTATATRPPTPAPPPPAPRDGAFRDVGTVRHANIHAQRYRLQGTAKVTGEVDASELRVEGILSVGGTLTADRVDSRGTLEVARTVRVAESFRTRGTARLAAGLFARSATTDGQLEVTEGVEVAQIFSMRGAVEIGRDLTSGLFAPNGRFAIGGVLRAKEIAGKFDGNSRVDRIEAKTVSLAPRQLVRLPVDVPILRPTSTLQVDRIEAESVEIEGAEVHYLRADRIVLGRHCHVTRLEGTVVRIDRSSYVGYESRSAPPYGLTR
ncbi:MAG: hypothetical protein ACREB9_01995 [Thermoplasmata archaeon]